MTSPPPDPKVGNMMPIGYISTNLDQSAGIPMGGDCRVESYAIESVGRGGGIRTLDILLPKQARYRAAPHPERAQFYRSRSMTVNQIP